MSKLLFDEKPLVIIPELAKLVGLNESIILQQVHYWVVTNQKAGRNEKEGYHWTYNTQNEWQEQCFPFWSLMTIRRTITNLEKSGLLISGNFNKKKMDRTKWYRVNYQLLDEMAARSGVNNPFVQNEQMDVFKMNKPIPESTRENNILTSSSDHETIFSVWNECGVIVHRKLTASMVKACAKALKDNSLDDILRAIRNYAEIINYPDLYYFSYKWSLDDFLNRGLSKFGLDLEVVKVNYRKDNGKKPKASRPPGSGSGKQAEAISGSGSLNPRHGQERDTKSDGSRPGRLVVTDGELDSSERLVEVSIGFEE